MGAQRVCGVNQMETPQHIVDIWFQLYSQTMRNLKDTSPLAARPPSLRDICYVYALSSQKDERPANPEMIESYVNGLELGAISALREAWKNKND